MNDLISRQAAIDGINNICPVDTEYDCTLLDRVDVRCVLSDLPSAQPEQQWIPCGERLPIPNMVYEDVYVYYLVQNEYGDMMVATFVQFTEGARVWQQMYQDGAIMEDIVAWMPLPGPWRGEEDADEG